jgi:hypothetical protein
MPSGLDTQWTLQFLKRLVIKPAARGRSPKTGLTDPRSDQNTFLAQVRS